MWSYQPNVLSPVGHKYILHIKVLSQGNKELAFKILYKLAQVLRSNRVSHMVVSRPNPWTPTKQMDSKFDSGYFQGATWI